MIAPQNSSQATVANGATEGTYQVVGTTADYAAIRSLEMASGSFLQAATAANSYTVVLGDTVATDLFGEATVTYKEGSLQLRYGVNTATLEHWQGDTFLAHWNLKGLMDDSMIAFSPNGKTMTLLNDRVEYRKTS